MFAPSARRSAINPSAWLMKASWARRLPSSRRSVERRPLSNNWKVGTTRTPRWWAAFVTAAAAELTYAR